LGPQRKPGDATRGRHNAVYAASQQPFPARPGPGERTGDDDQRQRGDGTGGDSNASDDGGAWKHSGHLGAIYCGCGKPSCSGVSGSCPSALSYPSALSGLAIDAAVRTGDANFARYISSRKWRKCFAAAGGKPLAYRAAIA
jgi:hypothetical protein